jgi:hypothetical protein
MRPFTRQLKHNIARDCAWRTIKSGFFSVAMGGLAVADGARCIVFSVLG